MNNRSLITSAALMTAATTLLWVFTVNIAEGKFPDKPAVERPDWTPEARNTCADDLLAAVPAQVKPAFGY